MSEPLEVQMARIQEQMRALLSAMGEAKESRQFTKLEMKNISDTVNTLDRRLENVEKQLLDTAPTIEEFITIKHQVKGAGIAGKWLWGVGGFLIAFAFSAREAIRGFFLP